MFATCIFYYVNSEIFQLEIELENMFQYIKFQH